MIFLNNTIILILLLIFLVLMASSLIYLILRRVTFSLKLSLALALSVVSFSLLGYWQWGGFKLLQERAACRLIDERLEQLTKQTITPEKVKTALDAVALQVQSSHFALAKLASVYSELKFYEQAKDSYSKAIQLAPEQLDYQLQWLANESMAQHGNLSSHALAVAERLINHSSNTNTVINLLAIHDYVNFNYENALSRWQYLLNEDEDLSLKKRQILQKAIYAAEGKIGKKSNNRFSYKVIVEPGEWFKQGCSKEDVVFVYLKSDAMPYPIAAVKALASKWPLELEIDNKDVMISVEDLSLVKKIRIFAKISKTGNALDKQSEWYAKSDEIDFAVCVQPVKLNLEKVS